MQLHIFYSNISQNILTEQARLGLDAFDKEYPSCYFGRVVGKFVVFVLFHMTMVSPFGNIVFFPQKKSQRKSH